MGYGMIENIGPIHSCRFELPEDGGVVLFTGANGAGKTHAINAVESAVTGRGSAPVSDGADCGTITLDGDTIGDLRMRVGKTTRRSGELQVDVLLRGNGYYTAVDPAIKDAESADAARLKAILAAADLDASADLFEGMIGGRECFQSVASTKTREATDPLSMGESLRRDLHAAARGEEAKARDAQTRAQAYREQCRGVDLEQPSDERQLADALEAAIAQRAQVQAQYRARTEAVAAAQEASRRRERLINARKIPDLESTMTRQRETHAALEDAAARFAEAQRALDQARAAAEQADRLAEQAQAYEEEIRAADEILEAQLPPAVSDEALTDAEAEVTRAREAISQGSVVRQAHEAREKMRTAAAEADAHTTEADGFRAAAASIDEVYTSLLQGLNTPLLWRDRRLRVTTTRGCTPVAELSHGERCLLMADVFLAILARGGRMSLLAIPQIAWEGLDPEHQNKLYRLAKARHGLIISGKASSGELRVETFMPHNLVAA